MSSQLVTRRRFMQYLGAGAAAAAAPFPLRAQGLTKVRIGYLHVVSVDAQLQLASHLGTWVKEGIEVEMREFTTGVELFQALVGGSLDVLTTGGVLSNFPARGQGKVFLLNDLEFATAQIWVHPDQGINSLKDLKGKKIAAQPSTIVAAGYFEASNSILAVGALALIDTLNGTHNEMAGTAPAMNAVTASDIRWLTISTSLVESIPSLFMA